MASWEKRNYTCAVCRTEAFDLAAPIGWLRVQRRIEADAQGDTTRIVGWYCRLECLAEDVNRWLARLNAVTSGS